MKNKLFKMISLFMAVVMVTTIIPIGTYANDSKESSSDSVTVLDEKEIEIECEIESKRTESSKTFLTSDGYFYQVSAAVPIHEEVNGTWEDIDEVDESSVENAQDASALVSELAERRELDEPTRLSDQEGLILLSNGNYSPKKIAGLGVTQNGIRSCIYAKPTINTDKSVFISNSTLTINTGTVSTANNTNKLEIYRLINDLISVENVELQYYNNVILDTDFVGSDSSWNFDITSYMRNTSLGIYANTGLAFVPSYSNTNIDVNSMTLNILYRELGEIDGKFESESVDLGRAGTLYLNDYSCNPVIVRNDLSIFDELEPANVQTIINQSAIDEYEADGVNTRINYYSTLQYSSGSNEYYWKNCEGNYIYFVYETSSSYKGYDNSGHTFLLTKGNNPTDFANITITSDKDDYTYSFETYDGKGYVNEIEDKYGNTIQISYTNGILNEVFDGSNRKFSFNYDNSDMLESISVSYLNNNSTYSAVTINNEPVVINYSYDNNGRLSSVEYPDDYTVVYQYDNNGRLSLVKSYEDTEMTVELKELSLSYYNYTSSSNLISGFTLKNHGNTAKSISVNSPLNSPLKRSLQNNTDNTEKIVKYDANAELLYCKDYNGQEYYLDYSDGTVESLLPIDENSTNLVSNGDFESGTSGWTIPSSTNTSDASISNAPGSLTNNALKMRSLYDEISTTRNVTVSRNTKYVVSCNAICTQTLPFKDDRFYSITVLNGTTVLGKYVFDYTQTDNWQSCKFVVSVPNTTSIKISLNCCGLNEYCYFDDVSVYKATDTNNIAVSDGTLISAYETVPNENNGTIASIVKVGDVESNWLGKDYSYDDSNYIELIDDEGKKTYYNYNDTNGLLESKGKNSNSSNNTQYTYSGIGALVAVQQAITNLNEANPTNQQTTYSYDDDLIKSITHNGYTYDYEYNNKNQIVNIKVSETENNEEETFYSVSYEYDNDQIGVVEFGNGGTITYEYDGDKITSVVYDNGETGNDNQTFEYEYEYDEANKVSRIIDHVANTVTTYNSNGCVISKNNETIYSNTGSKVYLFNDSFNYSSSNSTSNNIKTFTESFSASLLGPNVDVQTSTDSLERIVSSQITNKGNLNRSTHYRMSTGTGYVSGQSGRETSLVNNYSVNISKRNNIGSNYGNTRMTREWNYKYDDVGRITSVFRKYSSNVTASGSNPASYSYNEGNLAYYYQYDNGGEISLELDLINNIAIKYAYDAGGNLKSKTKYSISSSNYSYNYNDDSITVTLPNNGTATNYSYSNSGVTDFLTSFRNNAISYDLSGNPINYSANTINNSNVTGTMTWNGNLLTSFDDGDRYYEYTYDGDGRRTSKIMYDGDERVIPKSIIEYVWNGDVMEGYRTRYYGAESGDPEDYVLNWDKVVKLIYSDGNLVGASVIANENNTYSNEWSEYFDWEESSNYTFVRDGKGNITDIYDANEKVVVCIYYVAYCKITQNYYGSFIQELNQMEAGGTVVEQILVAIIKAALLSVYLEGMFLSIEQGYDGYIFDKETGLYYGQERYYCPSWGRFLNASDPMTLTENMGSAYNSNLFNYCNNDPINNISATGFNAPCTVISNSIIPQIIESSSSNLLSESRSTAKSVGEIETSLNTLGLQLSTTTDSDVIEYWDDTLNNNSNTVDTAYGLNYMDSVISKNTSSVTSYSVINQNTPYKVAYAIE